MALLLLLDWLAPSLGHTLTVGHIDHGLQAGRAEAEALVQAACAALGVPCAVRRCAVAQGAGLEARCRTARYAALQQLRDETAATAIVTAHHAADQAETLLLRMARGAGLDALQGVRQVRGDGVVRPLLQLDPADLHALLSDRPCWTDPTNRDPAHSRNRVRAAALPALEAALPAATAGLARTAAHLAGFERGAGHFIAQALGPWLRRDDDGLLLADTALPTDPAAGGLLVRWMAGQLGVAAPGDAAVAQLLATMRQADATHAQTATLAVYRQGAAWRWQARTATPTGAAAVRPLT
jgi:tRNA(Ile)-lysidine synthase